MEPYLEGVIGDPDKGLASKSTMVPGKGMVGISLQHFLIAEISSFDIPNASTKLFST